MLLLHRLRRFLSDDSGPTAVEYAIMLAMIIMVCFVAVSNVGSAAKGPFTNTATSFNTGS